MLRKRPEFGCLSQLIYQKVTNFYFLAKFFNDDYIKFLNFQIIRHWSRHTLTPHTKERGIFSVFEKKKFSEKKIKANFIVSRTTLCTQNIKFCMQNFFFEKCLFAYQNLFAVEKKNKKIFGLNFQNYLKIFLCRHQKNASHTIFIYENCMKSIFFKKRKPPFFITRLFYYNQTHTEMSLYQFSTIFRNCMKIVWQAFSHILDVWNCMISIFGVWRSTRVLCIETEKRLREREQ